jgi:hypothetical protein
MDDLLQRAYSAYFRFPSGIPAQPAESTSSVEKIGKLRYVVLRNNRRTILAVYRVRADGILRRMRRWPRAIRNKE